MTPDEHTIQELFLDVGDGHNLYVQDWGNKKAKTTIVFLHGGPGSSVKDKHKMVFDPSKQRVIFFDQRGCGQSTPAGSLKANNTDKLVDDINKLLDHLQLKQVIIHGGSWGSCLALVYGIRNPQRVKAMVLSGIFTGTKDEVSWLDGGRFKVFFPDVWQTYLDATPKEYQQDPSRYHFDRIMNGSAKEQKQSAYVYGNLEASIMKLDDRFQPEPFIDFEPTGMQIEMTYMTKYCFLPDNYVFDNAKLLKMPIYLVQGRYDAVCPPETAHKLSQLLPNAQLIWTTSGHQPSHESWNIMRQLLLTLST